MKESKDIKNKLNITQQGKKFPYEFEASREIFFYPELNPPCPPFTKGSWGGFHETILEIGPGRGDLLLELAEKNPKKKFIAVEIGKKRTLRMIPRIKKRNLKNILLICGDARVVLPRCFQEKCFETILVLFPDPWPKKRHAFRRLLTEEFLHLLAHFLKPGGHLIHATDVPAYAEWVRENLQKIPSLKNQLFPLPHAEKLDELPNTFFEEKWRTEGRKLHFFKYQKISV